MDPDPGLSIYPCGGTYPPSEDSYLLLSALEAGPGQRVLDMGTGTGIIGIHCAAAGCAVTAVDISREAAYCARMNVLANGLEMDVLVSDLFSGVKGKYDIVAFNPPYLGQTVAGIDAGTRRQITGGAVGHELSVRFLDSAGEYLAPGGRIYLLTSSKSSAGVLGHAARGYTVERVARRRLFFEVLEVHLLRRVKP